MTYNRLSKIVVVLVFHIRLLSFYKSEHPKVITFNVITQIPLSSILIEVFLTFSETVLSCDEDYFS